MFPLMEGIHTFAFQGVVCLVSAEFPLFGILGMKRRLLSGGTLKRFRRGASITRRLLQCNSKPVAEFRFLANLHLNVVHHFNRFVFLRQLKQFHRLASVIAAISRI
jgi:hypothetical protein